MPATRVLATLTLPSFGPATCRPRRPPLLPFPRNHPGLKGDRRKLAPQRIPRGSQLHTGRPVVPAKCSRTTKKIYQLAALIRWSEHHHPTQPDLCLGVPVTQKQRAHRMRNHIDPLRWNAEGLAAIHARGHIGAELLYSRPTAGIALIHDLPAVVAQQPGERSHRPGCAGQPVQEQRTASGRVLRESDFSVFRNTSEVSFVGRGTCLHHQQPQRHQQNPATHSTLSSNTPAGNRKVKVDPLLGSLAT